jgi:hypothetical protein
MNTNIYTFKCTGGFDINSKLTTHRAWNGDVVGFNLPDGSTVDLFVGLRVTNPQGEIKFINSEDDMIEFGFTGMEYDETSFTAFKQENPEELEEFV